MFINNFDPVAINLFSLEIRWYSLSYIFGTIIGWYYCKKLLIKDKLILEKFDDYIAYLIIGVILGGRFGYIFFYNPIYYISNPLEIIMLWKGGMSFHGAVLGIFISSYIYAKNINLNHFLFLDLVAMSAPIGIFLGRITNFINSELYGKPTDLIWSVNFVKVDNLPRHPSQIYEAIFEGLILFILLNLSHKKNLNKPGIISSFFLIYYSIFRFFIEFTREPDSQLGYLFFDLSMGQIISIVFFIAGLILFKFKNEFK